MTEPENIIHLTDLDTGKSEKRKALRAAIFTRFGGSFCAYCKCPLTEKYGPAMATIDHIIPRSRADHLSHSWANLLPCCRRDNNSKADTLDWRLWYRSQPFYDPDREKDIQATLDEWGISPPPAPEAPSTP